MGPTPSADLVGSIIGVDHGDENGLKRRSKANSDAKQKQTSLSKEDTPIQKEPPLQIVWRNVLIFIYLHAAALYGFYLCFVAAKGSTLLWCK